MFFVTKKKYNEVVKQLQAERMNAIANLELANRNHASSEELRKKHNDLLDLIYKSALDHASKLNKKKKAKKNGHK